MGGFIRGPYPKNDVFIFWMGLSQSVYGYGGFRVAADAARHYTRQDYVAVRWEQHRVCFARCCALILQQTSALYKFCTYLLNLRFFKW